MKTQKTKKSFKKKALLSSLSMLMVATVAVGSATFAWFTSSTSAHTENLSVKTTKSSELQVAKSDLNFGDTVNYQTINKSLRPASSADGENWYKAVAADKDAFAAKTGTYESVATNKSDYVFVEMLNIKNIGETNCTDVKITMSSEVTSKFARVALVPVEEQTEAGTMPSAAANFADNIYGVTKNKTWKPYDGSAVTTDDYSTADVINGKEVTINGGIAAGKVVSYKVIVWFEGEDADCYDTSKTAFTVPEVTFTVTGSNATT